MSKTTDVRDLMEKLHVALSELKRRGESTGLWALQDMNQNSMPLPSQGNGIELRRWPSLGAQASSPACLRRRPFARTRQARTPALPGLIQRHCPERAMTLNDLSPARCTPAITGRPVDLAKWHTARGSLKFCGF